MSWLDGIIKKPERLIIGLISGTSMDGIDAALVRVKGNELDTEIELLEFLCIPYSDSITNQLASLENTIDLKRISNLNFLLGDAFADAALAVIDSSGFKIDEIDLIGSHGQTIFHNPPSRNDQISSTLQLGELDVIAEKTGITTIGDFRTRDIAAEGEGAPLIPFVDYLLFGKSGKTIIAQNIGGIANCTVVTGNIDETLAFDTGPGNSLIDALVSISTNGQRKYDLDGELSSEGKIDNELLRRLIDNPYFKLPPPKSTGKEKFGPSMSLEIYEYSKKANINLANILKTLVEFTTETISNSYKDFIFPGYRVEEIILSGGGANNPHIVNSLKEKLQDYKISFSDDYGVPVDAKEALGFSILANETIFGNCSNIPGVTGAKRALPLGKIVIGRKDQR